MAEKKIDAKTYQALRAAVPRMDDDTFNKVLSSRGYVPDIPDETTGPAEWAKENPKTAALESVSEGIRSGFGKLGNTLPGKMLGAGLNAIENQPTAFDLTNPNRSLPAKAWGMTMGSAATLAEGGARLGRSFMKNRFEDKITDAELDLLNPDLSAEERNQALERFNILSRKKALAELVVPTDKLSAALSAFALKGTPKGQPLLKPLGPTEDVVAPLAGDLGVYRKTPAEALGNSGAKGVEDFLFGRSTAAGERALEKAQANNLAMRETEEGLISPIRASAVDESNILRAKGEDTSRNILKSNEQMLGEAQRDAALAKEAGALREAADASKVSSLTAEQNALKAEADKLKADYDALPAEYKSDVGFADGEASRTGAQVQKETFSNTDTSLKARNRQLWDDYDKNPVMNQPWINVDDTLVEDLSKMRSDIQRRGIYKNGRFYEPQPKDAEALRAIDSVLEGPGTLKQLRAVTENLRKGTPIESRLTSVFAEKAANSEVPVIRELGISYNTAVDATMESNAVRDSLRTIVKASSPEKAVNTLMTGQHTVNLKNVFQSSAVPMATKKAISNSVFENLKELASNAARGGKSSAEALRAARLKMKANYDIVMHPKMSAFLETHANNLDAMSAFTTKHPELASKIEKAAKDIEEILAKSKVDSAKRSALMADRSAATEASSKMAQERAGKAVSGAEEAAVAHRDAVEAQIKERLATLERESPTDLVSLSTREGEKGKRIYKPQRAVDKSTIAEATAVGTSGLLSFALGGPQAFGKLMAIYASFKVLSKVPGALARVYYNPKLVGVITAPARFQSNNFANAVAVAASKERQQASSVSRAPEPKKKSGWEALYKR